MCVGKKRRRARKRTECVSIRKSYYSENAFNNHIQSKKHREMEEQAETTPQAPPAARKEPRQPSIQNAALECMFCAEASATFDANLLHMQSVHGFFLPDAEYLQDPPGLIGYLASKVNEAVCLYCNGRGKEWKSVDAVRAHMVKAKDCR
ncbi:C2H2 type zinc-finger-domain-containing protein [Fennellomyces sp. T-0311]|nr:C2H2 type zinc-finger-domain-containing protein [Fennellomyces sp. T-0311]